MTRWQRHLAVIACVLLPRLPLLWNAIVHVDEAIFASFTSVWLNGGIPYVDCVETKPLGIHLFYALASWLAGTIPHVSMFSVHLLSIGWTTATAYILWSLGAQHSSRDVGFTTAILFAITSANFIPAFVATNIEVVLMLPWIASVWMLVRPVSRLRYWHSCCAGILLALAVLCKYQAGVLLPILLLYLWCAGRGLPSSPDLGCIHRARHCFCFVCGLAIPITIMMGYLSYRGAAHDFVFWNFQGVAAYIHAGNALVDVPNKIVKKFLPFIASSLVVWWLVGLRARINTQRKWKIWDQPTSPIHADHWATENLFWLWLVGSLVAVWVGHRFFDHYFQLLVPSASLLAAAAWPQQKLGIAQSGRRRLSGLLLFITVGFTAARFFMHPIYARFTVEDMRVYEVYGSFLQERTAPNDRILVWGFSPAIYWYANRLPAIRFQMSDVLVGRVPGTPATPNNVQRAKEFIMPGSWEMVMDDLAQHPPAYIIDMAPTGLHHYEGYPMTNYPRLMDFVRAHYEPQPDFQGAPVWKHR